MSANRGALLLALGLWLAATVPSAAETEYWSSDEAGFPIARLAARPSPPAAGSWWLELSREGEKETRRIFQGLEERRRVEEVPGDLPGRRLERSWEGKTLLDEIEYGPSGETLRESSWSKEGGERPLWIETYEYAEGRLLRLLRRDASGLELGSIDYRYDPKGRLLSLSLVGYYGEAELGSVPGPGLPRALWSSEGEGSLRIELFDSRGALSSTRQLAGDKVLSSRRYLYDEKGRLLSDREEGAEGITTLSTYGEEGRLASLVKMKGEEELERHAYLWDDKGRLLSDIRSLPLPELRIDNSWDAQGSLLKVERRIGGELVLVTSYGPGDVRVEETWAGGQAVVRTRYEGGIKVREDFLKDGQVLRTRSYP